MPGHFADGDDSGEEASVVAGRIRESRDHFLADMAARIAQDPANGGAIVRESFVAAAGDRRLADLYAVKLLEAVPGLGKVVSRRILDAREVAHRCAVADVPRPTSAAVADDVARELAVRRGEAAT